jgi:tetratricopeptide (TPR) repeat protein
MPTTVNGIGTRYGGKSNVETFFGVCESCHREVQLSNYETKLWFTVFFIPLIPLGKKQIFNYCPSCTRHGAMPLDQWQGIKQNAVEEQRAAWNQSNDPAAAIQLLETYAAFRQFDEARDLAGVMANRFANVANVQLALGQFFATIDQNEESERFFRKAHELEPGSQHARHALAIYSLQKDDPVSAERLLRQQPPITVPDNPQLHYMLGAAYHRQGRNAEALKTFRSVLEVAPQFGKNKEVRKLIRETEIAASLTATKRRSPSRSTAATALPSRRSRTPKSTLPKENTPPPYSTAGNKRRLISTCRPAFSTAIPSLPYSS